jgi:AcrR family transcriptional regulator
MPFYHNTLVYYCLVAKPSLRENILNAGLQVMFQSGYQGASVRDICAAARCTTRLVYQLFPDLRKPSPEKC